uniref:trypsin n=1 Tax=Mayetiola destructor TaxID=39758 RepID=Q5ISB8_MAYDE|nr:trypsin precursor [Mayetiola destructor]AAW21245.1 digestive serine protease I [Mayetiola destructor]
MFIKICFLLASILIASGDVSLLTPKPRLDGRIVGGVEIDIRDAPWQVTMQTMGEHLCGGSIISKKWILTAAHCTTTSLVKSDPERVLIKSGTSLHRDGTKSKVKRIINHPKWDATTVDYDFSLLELETELELDETRKVIKLANNRYRYRDGTMCLVTGWGDTHKSNESTDKLRGIEVPIYPQEKCKKAYLKQGGITDRMICAGFQKGGKDACQGDSGGPLALWLGGKTNDAELIGVVSWGFGCARPKYPGVYGSVSSVREWISEVTGI